MQPAEVGPFLTEDWERHSHRDVQNFLRDLGWSLFTQGDWAYAYASPSHQLVARVAPFDPGYRFFIELCSRCRGNPYLPSVHLASTLQGGGHLTVMEHLKPAEPAAIATFTRLWGDPGRADEHLQTLRREVDAMDRWGKRHHKRWWVGVDIGDRHILLSEAGTTKIIDLFGLGTPHSRWTPLTLASSRPMTRRTWSGDNVRAQIHTSDHRSRSVHQRAVQSTTLTLIISQENRRSRRLLLTTNTELNAIAAPARIGFNRPAAASGMAATL